MKGVIQDPYYNVYQREGVIHQGSGLGLRVGELAGEPSCWVAVLRYEMKLS